MEFLEFCNSCEKIACSSSRAVKLKLLKNFIDNCRTTVKNNPDFKIFSVFRLLLPHIDRSRNAYGVKEVTLAKLYIKILCLDKKSVDADRLLTYRVPKTTKTLAKDFAEVVYSILRRRCSNTTKFTVADINKFLDNFSQAASMKKQKSNHFEQLLQPILGKMSALEQKWLIRIVLRNVKLVGLSEKTVLSMYHPDAKELYDVCNDLEHVCSSLVDPAKKSLDFAVSLFKPVRPMLSDREKISRFVKKMDYKPFYVEAKLDGERVQIHKKNLSYGFYSRGGFDVTSYYGADPTCGNMTPRLSSCFDEGTFNCILDGEMVAWNVSGSFIISKGQNIDIKTLSPTGSVVPCFFVFDILLLNDEILTDLPYQERLKRLEAAVKVKETVLQFPFRKAVGTEAEVTELLNQAIDQREEGIVLKDPNSIYKPNERKGGWVKVKPEYVNSLMDHLDLIILGGYYGQGRRRDLISMFLLGVSLKSSEENKQTEGFYSFARVGSGFSDIALRDLLHKLNPYWKKWDKTTPPPMIYCSREVPDVWIEPNRSVILEIKASEIIPSSAYKTGFTLRFPRVERIREDRSWDSAMTFSEVKRMKDIASGKLATRHSSVVEDATHPKRRKLNDGFGVNVGLPFGVLNLTDVENISQCFSGKEFCVLNGAGSLTKDELERKIVSGGGDIVQHPGNSTFCIVAEKDDMRVKSYTNRPIANIVRSSWIIRCLNSDRLVPFQPNDLMVATQSTKKEMEKNFDKYGNSLTELTAVEDVASILQRVQELENPPLLSVSAIADLEFEVFGQVHQFGIFRTCVVVVHMLSLNPSSQGRSQCDFNEQEIVSLDLRMYGAEVVAELNSKVTHVVCNPLTNPEYVFHLRSINREREVKFYCVRPEWVTDSISRGSLVDERAYSF